MSSSDYDIRRSNGEVKQDQVKEGTINTDYSVPLIGKNVVGYGEPLANQTVNMLENFAAMDPPENPIPGQLWYDSTTSDVGNDIPGILKVNTAETDDQQTWTNLVTTNSDGSLGSSENPLTAVYANDFYAIDGEFHGTATRAKYADLAERYETDKPYNVGTIVKLGGEKEITETVEHNDLDVFGVISVRPAFVMNDNIGNDETHPTVGLIGRVPVKVKGKISKGQRIVSSDEPGVGVAVTDISKVNCLSIVGRALEDKTTEDVDLVTCVIGVR